MRVTLKTVMVTLALGLSGHAAMAVEYPKGYVTNIDGTIARSSFGDCWHTHEYKIDYALPECDPEDYAKFHENDDFSAEVVEEAPPAPTPPPAPEPLPPTPTPEPEKPVQRVVLESYTLKGDVLFDFDKADLRPEGKAALDAVISQIRAGSKVGNVEVSAYTDQMGSDTYNQALSQRRAETVQAYFSDKGFANVKAEGMGEANPVVTLEECANKNRAVKIACLQPNRRAVVELVATQEVLK